MLFGRYLGSFFKANEINYFKEFDPLLISSYSVTIFMIYDFRVILNGLSPFNNSYVNVPIAQASIFSL